ncbi:MAG TPA: carboxypeptidase regulatory-like domain-containing protein [Bryobacteraceae bacterium]|nr:carboxypeptidase regulatory-like domain-containing protein [Bryobacteraceae bacterium]
MRTSFVLMLLAAPFLRAQTTTTMFGTVTDKSGAVVPAAQVTATQLATNLSRTTQTNAVGEYRLEFLPIGEYKVAVSSPGFKKFEQTGIVLEVNVVARVDATLDVGTASEVVEVASDAPLVNTDNASLGRTVANAEITGLPIVNRNVYTLLSLTPGVQSSANSIVLGYPEQRTMIHGGVDGGAGSVSYYLDGGNNMTGLRNTGNINPNPDAVEEFRVITNSYSAEYGKMSGGVINVVTKSGSNAFHGSLFEFLRNDKLNANVWTPGGTLTKAPLHRNQFGGTAGGPIQHDKTFFFATYSGLRQITSTLLNTAVVPTALERTGDFSQSKVQPIDPTTKAPYPGGKIPSLDPTAQNIINKYIPAANEPQNAYQTQIPSPYNGDEILIKADHSFTDRNRLTGSYYETSGNNTLIPINSSGVPVGNLPWSTQQFSWRQQNINTSDTWVISPTSVDQVWVTYIRNIGGRLNLPQTSLGDLGSKFQIQGTPSLPQITVSGYFTLGQAIAGPVAGTNNYSVRDTLSTTKGRHTLKIGGEMSLNKDVQQTLLNNYGTFSFTGNTTKNALADFLIGIPASMNQDAPVTALDNSWSYAAFIQDDFRMSSHLSLNLGLRWDLQTPPTDPFNREMTFEPGVQSKVVPAAPLGMLFPGDPGVTRGIVPMRWKKFSPRLGFAWDPTGDGKTSIRGAAGVFFGSVSGNEWNSTSNFQPFAVRQTFPNVKSLTDPYGNLPGGVSPFPYSYNPASPRFITPANLFGIAPDFQWPYTYQLNFSVQRQVKDVSFTAAYVGALSHRLPFAVDVNYPYYNSTATTSNVNNRRLIDTGTLGSILSMQSNMNANYNGFQFTAERRMGRHVGFKAFYTYSKSLDGAQLQNNTTQGLAQDFNALWEEKGRADFDARHIFVASFIWNLDYLSHANPVLRAIANGWSLNGILTLRSGYPFTVTSGKDNNVDGNNNDRANLVGNPYLDPHRPQSAVVAEWFNTAAFVANPAGTDGNSGRNILDGPGYRNVDLGIFRTFQINERIKLQARAEATNAFNMVSLNLASTALATTANPNVGVLTSPLFGQVRNAYDMRQVQVGLRLTF